MRMHTHGKCSPNIIFGALTVFCVIVLYNYWTVSTVNHDLALKIHAYEEQIVSLSKNGDAMQAHVEKLEEIKEKVEGRLKQEQIEESKVREEISRKDGKVKLLLNDLENSKQETQNCKDDLTSFESKLQAKEKEVSEWKAKTVSLEAQLVEKGNKVTRIEKELMDAQKLLALAEKKANFASPQSSSKAPGGPGIDVAAHDEEPVLLNDPAVPYPKAWMEPYKSVEKKIHVHQKTIGDQGIQGHGSPVLIFDDPSLPRAKARFSILDRPKNEMKPDAASVVAPVPLKQPNKSPNGVEETQAEINNGGEVGQQSLGVLPIPVQNNGAGDRIQAHPPNLDAAEDDGDRPFKDDFGIQDDQSPDGALPQKEMNGAMQAPDLKLRENLGQQQPFINNHLHL